MAINILVEPVDPAASNTDWTNAVKKLAAHNIRDRSILTLWEDTASTPAAKQSAFISHAANLFQVQSSDESISGSLSAGINYIEATESGGVITLAWVTSTTGYSFNQAQGGIYNGAGKQLLRDVCYVDLIDGTSKIRGIIVGEDFDVYYLSGFGWSTEDETLYSTSSTNAVYTLLINKFTTRVTQSNGFKYIPITGQLNVSYIIYGAYDPTLDRVYLITTDGGGASWDNTDTQITGSTITNLKLVI